MFILNEKSINNPKIDEFEITGSTYEPIGDV
jgi:hypothetical protein